MARLLIFFLWVALVYYVWKVFFPGGGRKNRPDGTDGVIDTMIEDPNCGTFIPKSGAIRKKVRGREHCFCSKKCLKEYRQKIKP